MEKCRTWVLPPGLVATLRLIFPVDFVLINLIVCPHVRCFTELQQQLEMLADMFEQSTGCHDTSEGMHGCEWSRDHEVGQHTQERFKLHRLIAQG